MSNQHSFANVLIDDNNYPTDKRILIVTAVDAERDAVIRGLAKARPSRINVISAGVGPAAVAARTATSIVNGTYELVISVGIGGGFPSRASIGSLVLADSIVAADLGAETQDGFLSVDQLGFGSSHVAVSESWNDKLLSALALSGLTVVYAPIITVSSATGSSATAELRSQLVPGAAAEGMEGYGVAIAAEQLGIPVMELRAISNEVGPRDRSAWRIGEALQALEDASYAIATLFPKHIDNLDT
ncbi:futalosine hydrolase [Paenibacillus sp. GSMTC-2017]|uniref:futalosine hydrolase n=1 Tax=Paenibacillus sp. GSMTC-2017 TaxID=2794350 RepID=UPI0018D96F85|nr:futalosine hydrolase [Paenibacillus sp. GSMTC-2017]MBH5319780.1 futalosine hydrolase [Paenibacillus sp. GSMTC-2017]